MAKKILSLLLAFAMLASICAVSVSASGLMSGEVAITGAAGGTVSASVTVGNTDSENQTSMLVGAVYDANGRMTNVVSNSRLLAPGVSRKLSVNMNVPTGYTYKTFIWDKGVLAPLSADSTAPTAPTNLAVSSTTASTATLTWTAATDSEGVFGYRIYRDGVHVGTTTGTTYTDGVLAAGTYSYAVSAYNATGTESAKSAAVSAATSTGTESTLVTASFDFEKETYDKTAGTTGSEGLTAYKNVGATWVDTFDTTNYATTYTTATASVGTYQGRKCFVAYKNNTGTFGIGFKPNTDNAFYRAAGGETTFVFDYYDNGTTPINVRYRYNTSGSSKAVTAITRTGTNQWLTCELTVSDADFSKANNYYFYLDNNTENDPIYISKVTFRRGKPAQPAVPMTATLTADSTELETVSDNSYIDENELVKYTWASNGTADVDRGICAAPDGDGQVFFMTRPDATTTNAPKLQVHVDDTFVTSADNNIKIRVTYWDVIEGEDATNRVCLDYAGIKDGTAPGSAATNNAAAQIVALENKGGWKTCEFVLDNACFNTSYNGYKTSGDFRINTMAGAPVHSEGETLYIKSIEVIKY